jgi:hypothetical protein
VRGDAALIMRAAQQRLAANKPPRASQTCFTLSSPYDAVSAATRHAGSLALPPSAHARSPAR